MIRTSFALLIAAGPAAAHPGHLIAAGGHDHWAAGAALGAAAAAALWGLLKGRRSEETVEANGEPDAKEQEA